MTHGYFFLEKAPALFVLFCFSFSAANETAAKLGDYSAFWQKGHGPKG